MPVYVFDILPWLMFSISSCIILWYISKQRIYRLLSENETLNQLISFKQQALDELQTDRDELLKKFQAMEARYHNQQIHLAELRAVLNKDQEKYRLINELFDTLRQDINKDLHHLLASNITPENKKQLDATLQPLREQLKEFKEKVELVYDKDSKDRFVLIKQLSQLKQLNQSMTQEAINLTNALKGNNKKQGTWGEFVLENLLDQAGLRAGQDYFTQARFKCQTGETQIPDVVVKLPGDRHIVIDSKVSLKAYEQFNSERNSNKRDEAIKQHCQSLKRHVDNLASKRYQTIESLNTLDFVFLFVPIEAAFVSAINEMPELLFYAAHKNIMLTSPSSLMANLATIKTLWQRQKQQDNASEIANQAGLLFDQFVEVLHQLDQLGQHLTKSQKMHQQLVKQLTEPNHLLDRVTHLKTLGANTHKALNKRI